MEKEKKAIETRGKVALVARIVCYAIALVYFVILIIGRWVFDAQNAFYIGIDIFNTTDAPNVWLRSLSYIIFLLSLSYIIRFILKQITRLLIRGKALIDLLCSFIKYIAVIVLLFAILSTWGVNTTTLLAGIGILSLIVGLGAQPLIEDIIAGLFIVFENIFDVGDIIVVDGFRGTVKEIGIRTTQIEDAGGDVKVVNNSDIRTLVNMTSQLSLAISEIDIDYGEALERVEVIIKDNLEAIRKEIPYVVDGPYYLGVSKLGASGVTLRFTAKCVESQKFQVERDMNRQLKLLFDRNGIEIPFTQVVVHEAATNKKKVAVRKEEAKAFVDNQRELTRGIGEDENQN